MTSPAVHRSRRILWPVVEEHFEEAAFLWMQRERQLLEVDTTLPELAEGDEARLLAHLEGLVIAGLPAAEYLLLPALSAGDPDKAAVAALALLASRERDWGPTVLEVLVEGDEDSRPGLQRALELSQRPDLDAHLRDMLPGAKPELQARVLHMFARRQADTGPFLHTLPPRAEPPLWIAALRAARFTAPAVALPLFRHALELPHPAVCEAAIATGLLLNQRSALHLCRQLVARQAPQLRLPLLALARGGLPQDLELLMQGLAHSSLRDEVLWALGFSGHPAAAQPLLEAMQGEHAPRALHAFATLTGLPLEPRFLEPANAEDSKEGTEGEAQEQPGAELPPPASQPGSVHVEAVAAWWHQARARFEPHQRYLRGRPWTRQALLQALEESPLRHRPLLAWELAVRTRGSCQVESGTWAWRQHQQLAAAESLRWPLSPFDSFLMP